MTSEKVQDQKKALKPLSYRLFFSSHIVREGLLRLNEIRAIIHLLEVCVGLETFNHSST